MKRGDSINIKFYREKAGITQKQLAKKLNVDQTAVCHWEKGKNGVSKKYIPKLAKVLGCTVQELTEEASE